MNEREHTMDNYCEPRMRNTEVVVKSSQSETYQDFLSVDSDAKKKKKIVQYLKYFMIRLKP